MTQCDTLQEWLCNIEPETVEEKVKLLNESRFTKSEEYIHSFISTLIKSIQIRPKLIPLLSQVIIETTANNPNFIFFDLFKQKFFFESFCDTRLNLSIETKIPLFIFIRYLIKSGVFASGDEMQNVILSLPLKRNSQLFTLICSYFIPEVINDEIQKLIKRNLKDILSFHKSTSSPVFSNIQEVWDKISIFTANDFSYFDQCIEDGCFPDSIPKSLKYDDINELQRFSAMKDFSFDEVLSPSLFEHCHILQYSPPLISYSSFYGSIHCFKFLLLNNANLNVSDKMHFLPEHFAIAGGSVEIIHLIEQKKEINTRCLHIAAFYLRNDIFEWIISTKSCDITESAEPFGTILHYCAASNNTVAMSRVLKFSPDVNEKNASNNTALHIACEFGSTEAALTLLRLPLIDVSLLTKQRQSVLHLSVLSNSPLIIRALRETTDIDPNITDSSGKTALHIAVEKSYVQCVKELMTFTSIDPKIKTQIGETAMMLSLSTGDAEIVKVFRELDLFDPNDETNSGTTVLHVACTKGMTDLVSYLLKKPNVDVNKKDALSQTPLLHAICHGKKEIVSMLLAFPGIDVYATDNFGQDAKTVLKIEKNADIDREIDEFMKNHPLK